jgi:class 3 adenylate cyclase/predicted ATPase
VKCPSCGALRDPQARFCGQCGARLAAPEAAGGLASDPDVPSAVERRQITFVFCDLVGSTALCAELDPEDYKDILVAYRQAVTRAMLEFDGRIERHVGDGTLVYFGHPEAHEDDAERAIHASLRAIDAVESLEVAGGRRLQVRIGIATGLVVVADLAHFAEHDAMGDAPNVASRLQGFAGAGAILVDDATRRLAGELFDFRDEGEAALRGLAGPVRAWRVLGAKPVASRFEALRDRTRVPLVGRDPERRALVQAWEKARAGEGQVVLVTGDAGIGKSRLAAELVEHARGERCAAVRCYCAPYRQGSSLHPFVQYLEHAAAFCPSEGAAARVAKLDALLAGVGEDDIALLHELLNLPARRSSTLAALGPQARRRRTLLALIALLEHATRDRPGLVVFEDAQWSDDSSRELLALLVSRIARMPILLLVLARPGPVGEWAQAPRIERIELHPLPREASASLVALLAGDRSLPPDVVERIVARTDGIPLFLEEITQAAVEGGAGTVARAETPALPLLLRAALLPRLNRLGRAREVLEAAAAIGREFPSDLLARVAAAREDLEALLDRLVASGLVMRHAGGTRYTFKHALIRDAAYELMGRDKRRRVHLRIAESIEAHFPEAAATQPEVLAWHYTEAHVVQRAVECWLKAGRNALRRSAMGEALSHLRRGLEILAHAEESPWRLQSELAFTIAKGMAQIATQGYAVSGTGETFAAARALCMRLGEPPALLTALHGLWTHALMRGELDSALAQAQAIRARGEARGDPMWRFMGHRLNGVTLHPMGRFDEAIESLELGLRLYDPSQAEAYAAMTVDDARVVMLTYLSWSLMCAGRGAEAAARSDEALRHARASGHAYTLAHALNGAAFIALTIESPEAGLERLDELAAVLADNGIAYYEAVQTVFRGWCLAALGRHGEALPLLDAGLAAYRATHTVLYLPGFLRMSAESHARAGRIPEALRMIEEAMATMAATGQGWDEAEIHRVRGTILDASGDRAGAERELRSAVAIAARQRAGLWEQRAARSLSGLALAAAAS